MIELLLAVLAGAVLNLLFGLNEIFGQPEFRWKIFFQKNLIPTILNLVCGFILVWFREEIAPIFYLGGLSSVFLGFSGQVIFKKIQNMFDSKVNTYIGIEDK